MWLGKQWWGLSAILSSSHQTIIPHGASFLFAHTSTVTVLLLPTTSTAGVQVSSMASVQEVSDEAAFHSIVAALPSSSLAVIYFHAPWAKPCEQMSLVLSTLASTYPTTAPISFLALNAEDLPDVSEQYDVTAVPFLVLQRDGNTLETISGSDAARVRAAVEKHAGVGSGAAKSTLPPAQTVTRPPVLDNLEGTATTTPANQHQPPIKHDTDEQQTNKEELFNRLGELVKAAPVMLFMKGTPSAPQCGFSRQTVAVLREKGIRYGFFNILADDEVRQGLKEFADWPTFPQLWVDGELVGGLDIVSSPHRVAETVSLPRHD